LSSHQIAIKKLVAVKEQSANSQCCIGFPKQAAEAGQRSEIRDVAESR
jgi:hypothetical protein